MNEVNYSLKMFTGTGNVVVIITVQKRSITKEGYNLSESVFCNSLEVLILLFPVDVSVFLVNLPFLRTGNIVVQKYTKKLKNPETSNTAVSLVIIGYILSYH